MDKDAQKVIKAIVKAKGEIDFVLNRLVADIEGIVAKPVNFAPNELIEPLKSIKNDDIKPLF
jgi:hypothetical protein